MNQMKLIAPIAIAAALFAAKSFAADETNAMAADPAAVATKDSAPSYRMTVDTNAPSPELSAWRKAFGATHEQRLQWWRTARFGMFIHWGVYSVPAGVW